MPPLWGLGPWLLNVLHRCHPSGIQEGFWSIHSLCLRPSSVRNADRIWVRTPQNRTYRAWRTAKLTPMVHRKTRPTGPGVNYLIYFRTYANAIWEDSVRFGCCERNRGKRGSRGTGPSANRCLLRKSYIFLTSCEKYFSRQ